MKSEVSATFYLVDDSATIRFALKALLEKCGYQVVGQQANGKGLLEGIQRIRPGIVCLDYHLPDCNGLDLLKAIHAAHPAVSVIFITGNHSPELESEAAEAGAAGFIHKPFTQDQVTSEFHQVVHAHRLLTQAPQTGKPASVSRTRARAVIADDSATMRMLLVSILNENGVEVVGQATNGRQAIDLVQQHFPDIACLDIEMPVMTGLEALHEIHAKHPAVKVLMITGSQRRDNITKAASEGASGYIVKPYRREKVGETISRLIGPTRLPA